MHGTQSSSTNAATADALTTAEGIAVAWAASTPARPFANLGDALSPVIIAAISQRPILRRNFDFAGPRLAAVGTIAHAQKNGTVHLWGTGMDGKIDPSGGTSGYRRPANTEFVVHAVRGPRTRNVLEGAGIATPHVFGDPVWFLPKIMPRRSGPRHDLGVIVHLSELAEYRPNSAINPAFRRYSLPATGPNIKIVRTITERSVAAMSALVRDMLSCRRIASTSLHGLVIAEAYGIPCVWYAPREGGGRIADLENDDTVDNRVRDFYLGAGRKQLAVFGSDRHKESPWDELIGWIDRTWAPLEFDPAPLFEAFCCPRAVSLSDAEWTLGSPAQFDSQL